MHSSPALRLSLALAGALFLVASCTNPAGSVGVDAVDAVDASVPTDVAADLLDGGTDLPPSDGTPPDTLPDGLDIFEISDGDAGEVDACQPVCDATECGDDGCGGSCGECGADEICFFGACAGEGEPGAACVDPEDCDLGICVEFEGTGVCSLDCKTDSDCWETWLCVEIGSDDLEGCVPPCEPTTCEALGATCGTPSDGCWGTLDCGVCGPNATCTPGYVCACDFVACADGCCPAEQVCVDGGCCGTTDADCDGVDDDCNGQPDDGYVPVADCGLGVCLEGNSPSTCVDGVETPCQPGSTDGTAETICDGLDNDCDGIADEDYEVDDACGVGACQGGGTPSSCVDGVETPCQPGAPLSDDDATCDGVDDDCDGAADEDFQSQGTCGLGWCGMTSTPPSCADGVLSPCEPGAPLSDVDAVCDGVDDDCDGETDEDYEAVVSCGVGACSLSATPSSCDAGFETACEPGPPLGASDGVCDGVDDDCDGETDEDVSQELTCGVGACQVTAIPSSCIDGVFTPCQPGMPLVELDTSCNFYDDDCDGAVDEDADPPCAVGDPVPGLPLVFVSDLGMVSGLVTDSGDGTYSDQIIDLSTPNRSGEVWAGVQAVSSETTGFEVIPGPVGQVLAGVSRSTVTFDDPAVRVVAQVLDGTGGAAAPTTPVDVVVGMDDVQVDLQAQSLGGGLFSVTYDIPQEMFVNGAVATIDVLVDGGGETLSVTAVQRPTALSLDPGEAGVRLPTGPRFAGSTFAVPVVVNTGTNVLGSYNILLDFDTSLLEVIQVTAPPGSPMAAPVSNAESTANELGFLSFNGINVDPGAGSAVGAAFEVARVGFRVREDAPDGAEASISGQVVELYNTGLSDIRAGATLQTWDGAGQGESGVVVSATPDLARIFARAQDLELIDLQVVTGNPPSTTVTVHGLRADGVLEDITGAPGTACDAEDEAVVFALDCLAYGTGPGVTTVMVSAGGLEAAVPLRVLSLQLPVEVEPLDAVLGSISGLEAPQSTRMTAHGLLSDGAGIERAVNLSAMVSWSSTSQAIGTVDLAGILTPQGEGLVGIQAHGSAGEVIGTGTVDVDFESVVTVAGIEVLIPAKVSMTGIEPNPVPGAAGATVATAEVTDLLTSEGQQVQSIIRLILSDDEETGGGSRVDVTGDAALLAGVEDDGIASIDADGVITAQGSGDTQVIVAYQDQAGGVVVSGTAEVSVQLPQPVLVTATLGDPRIALSASDVSHTILGLPLTRQLTVSVQYADGTVKDLTADPRTIYTSVAGLVTVDGGPDCAATPGCEPGRVQASGFGVGIDGIQISFQGSYLSALSTGTEIMVVTWEDLILETWEEFTPAGLAPVPEVSLALIEGTGAWQGARATLRYVFTDGNVVDVTTHPLTTYATVEVGGADPADGIVSVSADAHLVAASAGAADLIAQNSGNFSDTLTIDVAAVSEDVALLKATYAGGGTFSGIKDVTTGQLDVYATFSDETRRMLTGASWLEGLLVFGSSAPEYATIDSAGVMTIHGNGPVTFEVDLAAAADTGPTLDAPGARYLAANLVPDTGDVDLGNPSGLPFPDRSADEVFSMPVRVNTGGAVLGGLDLEIVYDPDVIEILDVAPGSSIPGAIFAANPSKPGIIYLNAAPSPFEPAAGPAVEVAVITCKAVKLPGGPSVTPVGGTVVGVVDDEGGTIGPPTPRPIVAGDGDLDPDLDLVYGDANDDGLFSIADVLFVQQIIVVPPIVVPNETQLAQSDVFPDGKVASNDALFSSLGLARLAHFVELTVTPVPGDAASAQVVVTVTDRDQVPVEEDIQVRLEVGTWLNRDTMTFTLDHDETTNGLITTLVDGDGGTYETLLEGLFTPEEVGLVVIVDILGPAGDIVTSTAFLGTPEVDPAASFLPLDTYAVDVCTSNCDSKFCGEDDGCGLPCDGLCPAAYETCVDSQCACEFTQCEGACCAPGLDCVDGACCQQFTCDQLGAECATVNDGCGGTLDCGTCGEFGQCVEFINLCQCLHLECEGACCAPGEECFWGECTCVAQCDGADCGDPDGCGGLCQGPCPGGKDCIEGSCCVPDCAGATCGADDGCGGLCDGLCPAPNAACQDGECSCVYQECDGGACCAAGEACIDGACAVCEPGTCGSLGATCGFVDDGCGGTLECGGCGLNEECGPGFQCQCASLECDGACCEVGQICDGGSCTFGCLPLCDGALCGDPDYCGGFCDGACPGQDQVCWDGFCCTASCAGKACGAANGCNGLCDGPCPIQGQECIDGACCAPDCAGASCGDPDGCGGTCDGACPGDFELCQDGSCVCATELCDGVCCPWGETCQDGACAECFPVDCPTLGAECGIISDGCGIEILCGVCDGDDTACVENTCQCAWDLCGDGCCGQDEVCAEGACCPLQCAGATCGDSNGCGGLCQGSCPNPGDVCAAGVCCAPQCDAAACGDDDGCGGLCVVDCPDPDETCTPEGACVCDGVVCGGDCCPLGDSCEAGVCAECTPVFCTDVGAACGLVPDGCGAELFCGDCGGVGTCGPDNQCICAHETCAGVCCEEGAVCYQDQCWTGCVPDCDGKLCGANDGCGGQCNDAPCADPSRVCYFGFCCAPKCDLKACGDADGCGGLCDGPCAGGAECIGGVCCTPDCEGQACGAADGCGGICAAGSCAGPEEYCEQGDCVCTFEICGDGCCADGEFCLDGVCAPCEPVFCDDLGWECGSIDTGCGFDMLCGICPTEQECVDGSCACAFDVCGDACCPEGQACHQGECCEPQCAEDAVCGDDDACGGGCPGACPDPGDVCADGACCTLACEDASCGDDDSCGGLCVAPCPDLDETCTPGGVCVCEGIVCGDDCCSLAEICEAGACVACEPSTCEDLGAACGEILDGCGGLLFCGECGPNQTCTPDNLCACANLECGGECCGVDAVCYQDQCWTGCVPDCAGKACGEPNACGGVCADGPCPGFGEVCVFGVCCAPSCAGKGCGADDLCGGLCQGDCPGPDAVCVEGSCCQPSCEGLACGADDGCGGTCLEGSCPGAFQQCSIGECICLYEPCAEICCPAGEFCIDGACAACVPVTCEDAGLTCGLLDTGCGFQDSCGICADDAVCVAGTCECINTPCAGICCDEGQACADDVCCTPECAGAACGDDDGCGGACDGTCADVFEVCYQGLCCLPDCDGAACGDDDSCGGLCFGACPDEDATCLPTAVCACEGALCDGDCCAPFDTCQAGVCTPCVPVDCVALGATCGFVDDGCGGLLECGECAGNATCGPDNACECAYAECGGLCCDEAAVCHQGQCWTGCIPDCTDKSCGDPDGCGGSCSESPCPGFGEVCVLGTCCAPICAGKTCGADNLCGGVCDGSCAGPGELCVDGVCCAPDCDGAACGADDGCSGICLTGACGEGAACNEGVCACTFDTCGDVCCPEGQFCIEGACAPCEPEGCLSAGKTCGLVDTGCGFEELCGVCDDGQVCVGGACECAHATCGDGCCEEGAVCAQGACCVPNCAPDAACGDDDGCGGACDGTCPEPGDTCAGGLCCTPDCAGAACGDADSCGGLCIGTCPDEDETCLLDGDCACEGVVCAGDCCGLFETCEGGVCTDCVPATCAGLGATCGITSDGCGGTLDCGACGVDASCGLDLTCACDHLECGGVCCAEGGQCYLGQCWYGCVPDCDGKLCGQSDGCDGLCDDAPCVDAGQVCIGGACCAPDCDGKSCGDDDGCFGVCQGDCPGQTEVCIDGECCAPSCDDVPCGAADGCGGVCSSGTCADPLSLCVDGACTCAFEACGDTCCPAGEFCVDGACEPCTPSFCGDVGSECGTLDTGCGFTVECGSCDPERSCVDGQCVCSFAACGDLCCAAGEACVAGACVPCIPDCDGKACGDADSCGGVCIGTCPDPDATCTAGGVCACQGVTCGQDCCPPLATCEGGVCVDCVPQTCEAIGAACGAAEDGCGGTVDCGACAPDSTCGDGNICVCDHLECGGVCCVEGASCYLGQCWTGCVPDCAGKLCGQSDGCEGVCSDAPCPDPGQLCHLGACCTPDCTGAACGATDGCGGGCVGPCDGPGEVCVDGGCCVPDCDEAACGGDDGCGGACTTGLCDDPDAFCLDGDCQCVEESCLGDCCGAGEFCVDGACAACVPESCLDAGVECGLHDSGCGYADDCGACQDELTCVGGQCVCPFVTCDGACCALGEICEAGACVPCAQDCEGKACGAADGCGGLCIGPCPGDFELCQADGTCACAGVECGGVCCNPTEVCDQGACCLQGTCEAAGAACGVVSDGCGGFMDCGGCAPGEQCTLGNTCVCAGVTCGDACCAGGEVCHAGACCAPDTCADIGAECGAPALGCGVTGSCGTCSAGQTCGGDYTCSCDFEACGDACCAEGQTCHQGACCTPECGGKSCGDSNGCGGVCDHAPCSGENQVCIAGFCFCEGPACLGACCAAGEACVGGVCTP